MVTLAALRVCVCLAYEQQHKTWVLLLMEIWYLTLRRQSPVVLALPSETTAHPSIAPVDQGFAQVIEVERQRKQLIDGHLGHRPRHTKWGGAFAVTRSVSHTLRHTH